MTDKNENFLLIIDKETNIIIFTCLKNLKYLCSMENSNKLKKMDEFHGMNF
jgi:uncharacterized protein YuzE